MICDICHFGIPRPRVYFSFQVVTQPSKHRKSLPSIVDLVFVLTSTSVVGCNTVSSNLDSEFSKMEDNIETVKLSYSIHSYSNYTANFLPEHIMVNLPTDQLSRWFTDNVSPSQFIMLKLKSPSIVENIKFGKYVKAHVSDLKKFQIFGGTNEKNLSLLLTGGLKKDSSPETFRVRHRTSEGLYLPVQYIKIVPMQSWGPAYNYSIWYIELQGKNQEDFISSVMDTISLRTEEEAVRLVLKHLRRRRYKEAFEALSRETGVQLESPIQARLWNALVEKSDFILAEQIFEEAAEGGELEWYLSWQSYEPQWQQLLGCSEQVEARLCDPPPATQPPPTQEQFCADRFPRPDPDADPALDSTGCDDNFSRPGPRGGHQLVVDSTTGTLYLFGGWNGVDDLDDLWSYDTKTSRWTLLCLHSAAVGGPSPRSCHKMVFEPRHQRLYTIGRYLDIAQRRADNIPNELFVYEVRSGQWRVACGAVRAAGGPRLVFDHQMCVDPDAQTIYVFGGRVLPEHESIRVPQYSGLYAYYIETNTWQQLLDDQYEGPEPAPLPRVSHSMLFHPIQRRLYIFAGQRNKEHLVDLWWWDVETGQRRAVCAMSGGPPPAAGFTQRATLDPDTDQMFVLSGMSKEKDRRVYNTLWALCLRRLTWSCVYRSDTVSQGDPRPRFAHQLVYDSVNKVHYLFGGNPGTLGSPRLRLDDLWALRLNRGGAGRVVRAARLALRTAHYAQLAAAPACGPDALLLLRERLAPLHRRDDPVQMSQYHRLAMMLMEPRAAAAGPRGVALCPRRARDLQRRRARRPARPDLAPHLAVVLGADENLPEPPQPFEEVSYPTADSWDVADATSDTESDLASSSRPTGPPDSSDPSDPTDLADPEHPDHRAARIKLYDELCQYFRPSTVPPKGEITNIIDL